MAYTVSEIKVHAYNYTEMPDYTDEERTLFAEMAYCYDWFRAHPEDKAACMERMEFYIEWHKWRQMKEMKMKGSG